MFDSHFKLFDVNIAADKESSKNRTDRLVFNSCKAIVYDKAYSEFDEMTFANLNHNNYGFGYIEYEFSFLENFKNPYMNFYISCFALRMNLLGYAIKLNTPRPNKEVKILTPDNYTKVNQNGNLSFGIRFYFRSKEERDAILNSEEICIEGYVALGKKNNVYDIMCRIIKTDDSWVLDEAYTYRTNPNTNVYHLYH